MVETCGGCARAGRPVAPECQDAFGKAGLVKVHWECWSDCNLHCGFCYRTEDDPVGTDEAVQLIDTCRTSGVESMVFAGGDPSLRPDLPELIDRAHQAGLAIEIQSNFQVFRSALKERLHDGKVSLTGISLDGSHDHSHDTLRGARGNFKAVLAALDFHEDAQLPVIVRSLVNRGNLDQMADLARIVSRYTVVWRWSLLEFSPIGHGYRNRRSYEVSPAEFETAVQTAIEAHTGSGEVDVYRSADKVGTYGLITAAGQLYGTTADAVDGRYPIVGSVLTDHLADLAAGLPFSKTRHVRRYRT